MATDNLMPQSSTSIIKHFMLRSSTTGQGLNGKVASDFTGKYNIAGGAEVTLSFSAGTAGDVYSSGKICDLGLGKYAWHVPNAVFASLGNVSAVLSVTGGIDVHCEWQVVAVVRDAVAFGANTTTPPTVSAVADEVQGRTIARVTLVDTCTTNTDMRGTDDALSSLGSTAPTGWLDEESFAAGAFDAVWNVTDRSLTTFGTLVSDITAAVWAAASRTLTAFSFTPTPSNAAETTAIKAKTDNLPSDPADQSLLIDATNSVLSRLGTPAGASVSVDIAAVKTETASLLSRLTANAATAIQNLYHMITGTGVSSKYTVAALENAPAGAGGGSATLEKQEEILEAIDTLSITQLAAITVESGVIANFPETLTVGDSYTANTGRIKIAVTDADGDPITQLGSLNFADADISFTAFRPGDSALITGTCEFVDDISSTYVWLTLPSSQTILGKAEYTYEGRLKFFWEGPSSGTEDDEQKTYKTTPFKFVSNP